MSNEKSHWQTEHEEDDRRQFAEHRESIARVENMLKEQNVVLKKITDTLKPFEDATTFKRVGVRWLVATAQVIGAIVVIGGFIKIILSIFPFTPHK